MLRQYTPDISSNKRYPQSVHQEIRSMIILEVMSQKRRNSKKCNQISTSNKFYKTLIIGDSGVGKTNLLTRFCENSYKESYVSTIGVDFKVKSVECNQAVYKLQLWDTAGQERFKNIATNYYKGANAVILAYSITDYRSFENISRWMKQIDNHAPPTTVIVLAALKLDAHSSRTVSSEEGQNLASKHNISFFEVSSKASLNVDDLFNTLVQKISKQQIRKGSKNTKVKIIIPEKQRQPCC